MNHFTQSRSPGTTPRRYALLLLPAALVMSAFLLTPRVAAQMGGPGGPGGPDGPGGPPNTFAPSDLSASYSFSAEGDIKLRGTKLGTAEVHSYEFEAGFSLPAPESWMFSSSLSWSRNEFKLTGPIPLPKSLESVGFSFMAMKDLSKEIGPGWSAMAILNPGFASDSGEFSGDSFNLTAIAMIEREVSPTFTWSAGLVGNTPSHDMAVFPMIGLRWKFARDWSLMLGFPRLGVSYQVNQALSLTAGLMQMQGGTYYVSESAIPGLNKTYLEYKEMRVGLRAEYQLNHDFSLEIDAGMTLDRTADYYDKDFKLKGDSAAYGRIGLKYQF
jgi:hypothetical protein